MKIKPALSALLLLIACLTLPACNTIEGVGKDVQQGGESLENAARSTKEKL